MADLPRNVTYATEGASAAPPKATMGSILGWKKPVTPTQPAQGPQLPNVLAAYTPPSQEVKDFTSQTRGSSFLPETPVGAPAEQKISPLPLGYSPFRVPGQYTNPASGVVPEQPAIQQFPQGGQMNVDLAHPGTLNKSVRAALTPLSTENTSILGTLSPRMFQVDHIIPLWAGGADTIANKQILAKPVHESKTKIQSVAQTLLDHGEIDLNAARVMALTWQNRKATGIPEPNDYGEIPLETARALAKEWADFDAGKGPGPGFMDVVRGIPEAAKNLGKGILPEWARQFLVGMVSGATAGGVPLESAPGATIYDKASGLTGEILGMFTGIGAFSKLTRIAEAALFSQKGRALEAAANQFKDDLTYKGIHGFRAAPFINPAVQPRTIRIATEDTIGGASIFERIARTEKAAEVAGATTPAAKISTSIAQRFKMAPRNAINHIKNQMTSDLLGQALRNAIVFAEYGQAGQTISDFTQPQKDALGNHIHRLGYDLGLGGITGYFPGTWAGAGKVGFGVMTLGLLSGEGPRQALAEGVAIAGLHKLGGFARDPLAQQKRNDLVVEDAATKGSLTFIRTLIGDQPGLTRIDPSLPAPRRVSGVEGETRGQTLYRGANRTEVDALLSGKPQPKKLEQNVFGENIPSKYTLTTSDPALAKHYSQYDAVTRAPKTEGYIIEYKPGVGEKSQSSISKEVGSTVIQKSPNEFYSKSITKDDIARITDKNGKVVYEATGPTSTTYSYNPAFIDEWEAAARARINEMENAGQLKPFTGAGGRPGDRYILESNLQAATSWLRSLALPAEQRDLAYTKGLSSLARYLGERTDVNPRNPSTLPKFVTKVSEKNPEIINSRPAQFMESGRWRIEGESNIGEGDPTLGGLRGEVRLTGQGTNITNKEQLESFLKNLREQNASPFVFFANQPELAPYFRDLNRSITPEDIKSGKQMIDPENYISVWGIVKDPKTGEVNIVQTGVKVPTQQRIGVVSKDENGVRQVEGNEFAFNKDASIASGKWPEENPNFNNKTIATHMRATNMPLIVARIKAYLGEGDPHPYLIAQIGDKEWHLSRQIWNELGPAENLSSYEENIARAVAEKGRTNTEPLLLKAASQLSERGHNAASVVASEKFIGINEPRQTALFELSNEANKVLTTAKTPEEVQKGFSENMGINLTPAEAHTIEASRSTMTGKELMKVVDTAVNEGRTTPETAGVYVTYLKPLETSRVFNSSGAGLLFDKMPILSKPQAEMARADKITTAATPAPVVPTAPTATAPKPGLLEQTPITKAPPTEGVKSPEYTKALEDLKMVGLGTGRQIDPQGLDAYVDTAIRKIQSSPVTPEEKKSLGTELLKLINAEELNARAVSMGRSEEAWMKGQRMDPEGFGQYINSMRDRIKAETGAAEPVSTRPSPEEIRDTRMRYVPEMTRARGTEFITQTQNAIETLPKDSYGYAFHSTFMGGLQRALAHGKVGPEANYDLQRFLSWANSVGRGYWGRLFETIDDRTGLPFSQPKSRIESMAKGAHGKTLEEQSAARRAELEAEAPSETTPSVIGQAETGGLSPEMQEALPEWMQMQTEPVMRGTRVEAPTQSPSEHAKDLTRMEAYVTPGRIALEEGKISEIDAGIEDGKRFLQNLMREYNKYIGSVRETGKRTNVKMKFISDTEWDIITSSIRGGAETPGRNPVEKFQAQIEELQRQDEALANVGGTKATAYAKKVKEANTKTISQLQDLIKKYSGPEASRTKFETFTIGQSSPSAESAKSVQPIVGEKKKTLIDGQGGPGDNPSQFGALPGSSPSQSIGQYLMGRSVVENPPKLQQVDTSRAEETLAKADKILNAPIKMGETTFTTSNIPEQKPAAKPNIIESLTNSFKDISGNITDVLTRNKPTIYEKKEKNNPIISGYDTSEYAEDPVHAQRVRTIMGSIPAATSSADIDVYIKKLFKKSPITGDMVWTSSRKWGVPPELLVATMQQDSGLGTTGSGAKNRNPGNVGTYTNKKGKSFVGVYPTWKAGVDAVAQWLSEHKVGAHPGNKPPVSQYVNQVIGG